MNPEELREIIERLDAALPRENARVSIQTYGEDMEEAFLVATGNGYLRLGVEFLKAGVAPYLPPEKTEGKRPHAVDVDLDYLLDAGSDVRFDYFERNEELPVETEQNTWLDKAAPVTCMVLIIAVGVLALLGLSTIVKAL